jgi:cytochrome c biogenesis protein CcdA
MSTEAGALMSLLPKRQLQPSGDELHAQRFRAAVAAAERERDAIGAAGEKRVSVAAITAGVTGTLAVLGASADGLETLKPSELEWVLTTGAVVLAAIILVLFAVLRVTRLSKQETDRLRAALITVIDAANDQLRNPRGQQ